jgi:sodium-coupled neutral amino acid transporter 11
LLAFCLRIEKSTVTGATLNSVNSIIGAGIIGLPYAFQQAGFLVGLSLLIFLTIIVGRYKVP